MLCFYKQYPCAVRVSDYIVLLCSISFPRGDDNQTILHIAIKHGKMEFVKVFFEEKYNGGYMYTGTVVRWLSSKKGQNDDFFVVAP